MSKIKNKLFLGNWFDAQNLNLLKRFNVSHILCCSAELRPLFQNYFVYKHIKANDHPSFNLGVHLDSAADFIHNAIENGKGIFVHCYAGISRSTTCLIAYLIKYRGMNLVNAISMVRKKRPIINPNPGFIGQLKAFEKKIRRREQLGDVNAPDQGAEKVRAEIPENLKFESMNDSQFKMPGKGLSMTHGRFGRNSVGSVKNSQFQIKKQSQQKRATMGGSMIRNSELEGLLTYGKVGNKNPKRSGRASHQNSLLKSGRNQNKSQTKRPKKKVQFNLNNTKISNSNYLIDPKGLKKKLSEKLKPKPKTEKRAKRKDYKHLAKIDPKLMRRHMPVIVANPLKPTMNKFLTRPKRQRGNSQLHERYKQIEARNKMSKTMGKGSFKSRASSMGRQNFGNWNRHQGEIYGVPGFGGRGYQTMGRGMFGTQFFG